MRCSRIQRVWWGFWGCQVQQKSCQKSCTATFAFTPHPCSDAIRHRQPGIGYPRHGRSNHGEVKKHIPNIADYFPLSIMDIYPVYSQILRYCLAPSPLVCSAGMIPGFLGTPLVAGGHRVGHKIAWLMGASFSCSHKPIRAQASRSRLDIKLCGLLKLAHNAGCGLILEVLPTSGCRRQSVRLILVCPLRH